MGVLLLFFSLAGPCLGQATVRGPVALKVGVWSIEGDERAIGMWSETTQYLSQHVPGYTFILVPLSLDNLVAKVRGGELDFVIVDPAVAVQIESDGVDPIATAQTRFKAELCAKSGSVLFSRASSREVMTPGDLRVGSVATVSPQSLEDWLAAARELEASGLDLSTLTLIPCKDHREVVKAVLQNRAKAGCIPAGALERLMAAKEVEGVELRVLEFKGTMPAHGFPMAVSTRLYPAWSFAACRKVDATTAREVAAALLSMSYPQVPDRAPGSTVEPPELRGWAPPPSNLAVHELLRELRLPPYENLGQMTVAQILRQYIAWFIAGATLIVAVILLMIYAFSLNRALRVEAAERERAEEIARQSAERFEHIAACSVDWIWETDAQRRFTYSSQTVEQILGYPVREVLGHDAGEFLSKAEKEKLQSKNEVFLGDGKHVFRERFRFLTKDKRIVILEVTVESIFDERGLRAGFRGVARDVTSQVGVVRLEAPLMTPVVGRGG